MARLARSLRSLLSPSASSRPALLRAHPGLYSLSSRLAEKHASAPSPYVPQAAARTYISEMRKSAFEGNILRIIRNEIEYELELCPPAQPVNKYDSFIVDDRPGEQWISLKRKYGDNEDIAIEATMFDGAVPLSKAAVIESGDAMQLHITIFVTISKGEGGDVLEFVCSALPDSIEIRRLYTRSSKMPPQVYLGPQFKELDNKLQELLYDYLEERGVSDELAGFLHEYMRNKDKIELIRWMGTLKSFVEKKR
ncbi:uncharacterized protein At2g39795, mitochondrial-like [Punica granatum]|uniref:Mitochondrial acidic protein MAM33 n=2 Tax=Punica granatum TaxID=22663 RepID=A0A218WEP7_PUNGR|nr:uncharacterized protein At2g39795, mitochondrial-like [Punica granatum]OWM71295.1 hypothetical protein CDL15_Pgr011423 [Punica granatum]PKI59026.1 hypothetical protein CRG98_020594 [Punica granatum]